ncbi:cobalt-precorrin-6x reductase [Chondrocystis sp. NIES-4102]|nr:cobalt-precorrin-6x reductase [Chondrocystis sp. NIES-4102]
MRILILGGTEEASQLAIKASAISGIEVITSLAGRTIEPKKIATRSRIGGFGGACGLVKYLQDNKIDRLIDATHPFATQISHNAAIAAKVCHLPHLILTRRPWQPTKSDRWIEVSDLKAAADILPTVAQRVFLTIGRQELATFTHLKDLWFLMRMIDHPQIDAAIPNGKVILQKGPFSLVEEEQLLIKYQIEAIVSKNSGGEATYAKILAARALNLPVIMVQRPLLATGKSVSDVESALNWISH